MARWPNGSLTVRKTLTPTREAAKLMEAAGNSSHYISQSCVRAKAEWSGAFKYLRAKLTIKQLRSICEDLDALCEPAGFERNPTSIVRRAVGRGSLVSSGIVLTPPVSRAILVLHRELACGNEAVRVALGGRPG